MLDSQILDSLIILMNVLYICRPIKRGTVFSFFTSIACDNTSCNNQLKSNKNRIVSARFREEGMQ